jgi:hypothetical protein
MTRRQSAKRVTALAIVAIAHFSTITAPTASTRQTGGLASVVNIVVH